MRLISKTAIAVTRWAIWLLTPCCHFQAAAGDAKLMVDPLLGPDVPGGHPTCQSLGIKADAPTRRGGILIEKFKPNPAHTRPQK